ncbi:MAG: winged helix-turn-helix transcriptional regulator [Candidatus Thorarchaeota archaeon]
MDKRILLALDENCRLSYQALADMLGVTANAVKKRMDRLIETGVIEEFSIVLKPAMMNSDYLIALISTDGTEDEEKIIDHLGSHLTVVQVGQIVTASGRLYFLHCEYVGNEGLKDVSSFLRTLESVKDIELHTTLTQSGVKFEIKNLHLRVLKHLLDDARMQVSEISEKTGLASRRVSRAIQEMHNSNAFWFAVRWNLSLGQNTEFYLKVEYDEQASRMEEIDEWFRDRFPNSYWFSFYSAMDPVLFAKFVTEHFREAEDISRVTKNTPFSKKVDVLLSYPVKKFPRLGRIKIEEMIQEAGI